MTDSTGWQPIETAPNDVFDVLVKHWDASLDKFLYRRICDCVQVKGEICAQGRDGTTLRLFDCGYRPTHWRPIPELPDDART